MSRAPITRRSCTALAAAVLLCAVQAARGDGITRPAAAPRASHQHDIWDSLGSAKKPHVHHGHHKVRPPDWRPKPVGVLISPRSPHAPAL